MNIPNVLTGPGLELLRDAHRHFGAFTKENEPQVKAWIAVERERRGLDAEHVEPPKNVRPFREIETLDSEDGWA